MAHTLLQKQDAPVVVRRMEASDIDVVVRLHLAAFPNFFLSFLGRRFLKEFYNGFLIDHMGVGFVAEEKDGVILGAIVGASNPSGFFGRLLKRRWWAFCIAAAAAVLKKPSCVPRLFRALLYRGDSPEGPVRALLSSIAVVPSAQGRGVGKVLLERWISEIVKSGVQGCYLTTDACKNETVNAFYRGLGWHIGDTIVTPEGRRMHRYLYNF